MKPLTAQDIRHTIRLVTSNLALQPVRNLPNMSGTGC